MITDKETALKVAEFLLKIKAVRLSPDAPFTWASGWKSPIYCDNRLTLSYPEVREAIKMAFVEKIRKGHPQVDAIVGVATGGIAIGALIAEEMGLPFAYVRSGSKGHGMKNRVEGHLEKNAQIVVIEDLISTGGSSLSAVEALREEGIEVEGMLAIFSYGFDVAKNNFAEAEVKYATLSDFETLAEAAQKTGYLSPEQEESLLEWRKAPDQWKQDLVDPA